MERAVQNVSTESLIQWALLVPQHLTKQVKVALEDEDLLDKTSRITKYIPNCKSLSNDIWMAIPLLSEQRPAIRQLSSCYEPLENENSRIYGPLDPVSLPPQLQAFAKTVYLTTLKATDVPKSKLAQISTPLQNLHKQVQSFIEDELSLSNLNDSEFRSLILENLPSKWEQYNEFVLLPETAFVGPIWTTFFDRLDGSPHLVDLFFSVVARSLSANYLARKARISADDILRRPHIVPLFGNWGCVNNALLTSTYWARTVQNSIAYTWSPLHTMFSAGNITEKHRVATSPLFSCENQIVVDLYAGIGYFVFPYLINQHARVVHACEWSPWAAEALKRGALMNGIKWQPGGKRDLGVNVNGLFIYEGDNAQAIEWFEDTAQQVNLGLLPTSESGWAIAVRALNGRTGGYLHVHENLKVGTEEQWKRYLVNELKRFLGEFKVDGMEWMVKIVHMEKVKSFAPKVNHWVADAECRPSASKSLY